MARLAGLRVGGRWTVAGRGCGVRRLRGAGDMQGHADEEEHATDRGRGGGGEGPGSLALVSGHRTWKVATGHQWPKTRLPARRG